MSIHSIPPIFVINVKSYTERRQHITQELQKLALPYRMIEAVDGQLLSDDEIQKVYSEKETIKYTKRPLSNGEIACALSHISIYQTMLAEDIKEAIILEDDAALNQQFIETVHTARTLLPKDWQLLLLGYGEFFEHVNFFDGKKQHRQHVCRIPIAKSLSADLSIALPLSVVYGGFAYLINQSGAKQLLEKTQLLSRPFDCYTGDRKIINLYCVEPRCASINRALQSSIEEDRARLYKKNRLQSKTDQVEHKTDQVKQRIRRWIIQWLKKLLKQHYYFIKIFINILIDSGHNNITCAIRKIIYYTSRKKY